MIDRVSILPQLLARVREAAGPDREIDIAICVALFNWCIHQSQTREGPPNDSGFCCDACSADSWGNVGKTGQKLHEKPPALTGSIDSAVALAERVLPGWWDRIERHGMAYPKAGFYRVELFMIKMPEQTEVRVSELGNTRALAYVASILAALIAREGK